MCGALWRKLGHMTFIERDLSENGAVYLCTPGSFGLYQLE